MMRYLGGALIVTSLVLGGCGKELLAGGFAEIEAAATDEAGAQSDRAPSNTVAPDRETRGLAVLPRIEGTLSFQARVELVREDGLAVPVATGAAPVQLRIGAGEVVSLGREAVRAGRYTAVRITFTAVEATVTEGVSLGSAAIRGRVPVGTGAPIPVERPISLVAAEGGAYRVLVDLNSRTWIPAVGLDGIVPAAVFAQAVRVTTE